MRRSLMLARGVFRALAALGLLLAVVTATPMVSWYAQALAGPWNSADGDVLIVLSAAGPNFGVMDGSNYWRCAYAVLTYRDIEGEALLARLERKLCPFPAGNARSGR